MHGRGGKQRAAALTQERAVRGYDHAKAEHIRRVEHCGQCVVHERLPP